MNDEFVPEEPKTPPPVDDDYDNPEYVKNRIKEAIKKATTKEKVASLQKLLEEYESEI